MSWLIEQLRGGMNLVFAIWRRWQRQRRARR
jgi:hypothetical protein